MTGQGNPLWLIAGCGQVGVRLANALAPRPVTGLVRSAESGERLRRLGITPWVCDLDRPLALPGKTADSRIWYLAPPPPRGRTDPRLAHFLQALEASGPPQRLVYLGTTGVYGDCAGAWVDEHRPLAPVADRARRRADAEARLQRWCARWRVELIRLRVAGIYGPGKLPLERLRARRPMIARHRAPWTNRIHLDDLVQVLQAAMARGRPGEVYNVSDGRPGNMADYFNAVADAFGLPRPPVIDPDQAEAALSPGLRSYLSESRRIDNRKMLRELGVTLRHPDLESGLAACRRAMVVS